MKKRNAKNLYAAASVLAVFALWTAAICFIDVRAIGPRGSSVGFTAVNKFVHSLTGVHMSLYNITDWLGLVPIAFVMGFAVMGLIQWTKRKSLLAVDYGILVLGGFYIVVMAVFILFETFVVNYRPVLINGVLEASYPSSTTLLVTCVMPTAITELNARIKNGIIRRIVCCAIGAFTVFMVLGRLISGVHWFTDIVGGLLLSAGLLLMYRFAYNFAKSDL